MSDPSTWIKLNRNILEWGWYKDSNTKDVFIHLILKANVKDKMHYGTLVKRGQLITSYGTLSTELNMSVKSVRTALNHLKRTNEVAIKSTPNWSLITVENYDKYQNVSQEQDKKPKSQKQGGKVSGKQRANEGQTGGKQGATTKEYKNIRSKEYIPLRSENPVANDYAPKDWEAAEVPKNLWGRFDSLEEWRDWRDK